MSDVKSAGFWIGNIFTILATVLGVYLAATQGFKRAMHFDAATTAQKNYYLRQSLRNELATNVEHIHEYIRKVENRIDKPELVLDTFVWDSMTYSSYSLETPSPLLAEAQRFYRRAMEIMNTPYYNNTNKAQYLKELADHIAGNVLPLFDSDGVLLREKLSDYGVDVS